MTPATPNIVEAFAFLSIGSQAHYRAPCYYTPDSLVQCLLDSALDPVIAERLAKAKTQQEKETALLSLKVCDMAVDSGHVSQGDGG